MKRLTLGLLAAAFVTACSTGSGGPSLSPPAVAPTSPVAGDTPAAASIDQAFIDMMVPHHQSAVEMAQLAQDRAEHDELKTLAGEIISAQEREIEEMKAWRAEWFGSGDTPPMDAMPVLPGVEMPGMEGHGMGDGATMDMTADIDMLRDAQPFDASFIEAMIAHHQSAIDAAEVALAATQRPEIRGLAEDIIESQQAEIAQLEAWSAEWYPDAS